MRGCWVMSVVWLTMLVSFSQASQSTTVDDPQPWVFSGEDSGTNSYLGVDIADITSDRMNALKLKEEKGVEVTMVDQDAPAGKAGIKEHDVIVSMNGTTVESGAQLRRMIHETPPGRVVTFGLSRDGQPLTVKVQLADKHKEFAFVPPRAGGEFHVQVPDIHVPDVDIPAMHMIMVTSSARSGLTVENITPQLGEFFGVKNGNGVLVRAVEKGSRAERAGFRAGDVIVKINGQQVHDTSDFSHAVRENGNPVNVGVMRDKKEQNLTLTLPSQKDSGELFNEETFGGEPLIRAESELELTKFEDYVAKLRPEMQLAADSVRQATEEVRKETCREQRELRRQTEKQKRQMQKDLEQLRLELRQLRVDWL
jgi:serine protease Do